MSDEEALLQAIRNQPHNTLLRLVLADYLEEQGDPQAELLGLLHTLTQSTDIPKRSKLENRLQKLLQSGVQSVGPFVTNNVGMRLALISPGVFMMGNGKDERGRMSYVPNHKVTLTKGFYMSVNPLTVACWRRVMGNVPAYNYGGDNVPVINITWTKCQEFLRTLSEQDGHKYRLPSEAEWEYACRAGTTTRFSFGQRLTTDQANFKFINKGPSPVGSYPENAWGLRDMHGNGHEWCADWYGEYPHEAVVDPEGPASGAGRVVRGGSYTDHQGINLRSSSRIGYEPDSPYPTGVGFRVVRAAENDC